MKKYIAPSISIYHVKTELHLAKDSLLEGKDSNSHVYNKFEPGLHQLSKKTEMSKMWLPTDEVAGENDEQ